MLGTAMPGWRDHFGEGEFRDLIDYLKSFSPFFEPAPAEPVMMTSPGADEEALAEGRSSRRSSATSHGRPGDGPSPTLEDDDDRPVRRRI